LTQEIKSIFDIHKKEKEREKIRALILPHAAYNYSGKTAVMAIQEIIKGSYNSIIIIGPAHRISIPNLISVPLIDSYWTPLGKVFVDKEKGELLIKSSEIFKNIPLALKKEHSVQIQIPLLQYSGLLNENKGKILFLITGNLDAEKILEAAEKIKKIFDENTLLIVSSDFTHYGERFGYLPFKNDISQNIRKLDMTAFSFIQKGDFYGFQKFLLDTSCTICGAVPLSILTALLDKNDELKLVDYSDSSIFTGDNMDRVSYISAILLKKKEQEKEIKMYTRDEQKILLKIARETIRYYLETDRIPDERRFKEELTEKLLEKRAAFVTLTIKGRLRGCVGEIFPSNPLYISVMKGALNAAFYDSRFMPLFSKNEFEKIHIEISILSLPQEIESYKEIVLGRDGIILQKRNHQALFLPQVAVEQNWNLEETLSHLALKAGLGADEWRSGCSFKVFQAEVFGEDE